MASNLFRGKNCPIFRPYNFPPQRRLHIMSFNIWAWQAEPITSSSKVALVYDPRYFQILPHYF